MFRLRLLCLHFDDGNTSLARIDQHLTAISSPRRLFLHTLITIPVAVDDVGDAVWMPCIPLLTDVSCALALIWRYVD